MIEIRKIQCASDRICQVCKKHDEETLEIVLGDNIRTIISICPECRKELRDMLKEIDNDSES